MATLVSLAARRSAKRRKLAHARRYRVYWHRATSYHLRKLAEFRQDSGSLIAEWYPDLYAERLAYRHLTPTGQE